MSDSRCIAKILLLSDALVDLVMKNKKILQKLR